jgi:hypothetical protein
LVSSNRHLLHGDGVGHDDGDAGRRHAREPPPHVPGVILDVS